MTCAPFPKIAELRFPNHEAVGAIEAVAVFESEDTGLRKR